jgi:hypothetical protein
MTPTTDNVLSVYRRASFDAFSFGMTWYDDANAVARDLGGDRFHRAAGVIAALSPMNRWPNNKAMAYRFFERKGLIEFKGTKNGIGIGANVRKAIAIYNGEDALDILGGDKVRAFYLTILDPNAINNPVIDRHAFDIAVGMRTNDKIRGLLNNKGQYDRFSNAYVEAATIANISACQMQAITWEQWRSEHGIID